MTCNTLSSLRRNSCIILAVSVKVVLDHSAFTVHSAKFRVKMEFIHMDLV